MIIVILLGCKVIMICMQTSATVTKLAVDAFGPHFLAPTLSCSIVGSPITAICSLLILLCFV